MRLVVKVTSKKQKALCERCSFLSPDCWPEGGGIDCWGDKHRESFIQANGFEPLPKREQEVDVDLEGSER